MYHVLDMNYYTAVLVYQVLPDCSLLLRCLNVWATLFPMCKLKLKSCHELAQAGFFLWNNILRRTSVPGVPESIFCLINILITFWPGSQKEHVDLLHIVISVCPRGTSPGASWLLCLLFNGIMDGEKAINQTLQTWMFSRTERDIEKLDQCMTFFCAKLILQGVEGMRI